MLIFYPKQVINPDEITEAFSDAVVRGGVHAVACRPV
jgi:hypothetical protein